MKVIFLDVDGVLNNESTRTYTRNGYYFVEDDLITNLKTIVEATGAKIVLSSTWRLGWTNNGYDSDVEELVTKLADFDLELYDRTGDTRRCRGFEIQEWLNKHNEEVENFIIIDDWEDMAHLASRLLLTDARVGLTVGDVQHAINFLNKGCALPQDEDEDDDRDGVEA